MKWVKLWGSLNILWHCLLGIGMKTDVFQSCGHCWVFQICWPNECNGEGNSTPLQYSCLENPMGGRAWKAAVHGVSKSRTRLSDFTFTFHFHALEKEMATHSSVLAWRIPGMGEPGRLPSVGSHRVEHDWSNLAAAVAVAVSATLKHHYLLDLQKLR